LSDDYQKTEAQLRELYEEWQRVSTETANTWQTTMRIEPRLTRGRAFVTFSRRSQG